MWKFPGSESIPKLFFMTECNVLNEPLEGGLYQAFNLTCLSEAVLTALLLKGKLYINLYSTEYALYYSGLFHWSHDQSYSYT